MQQARSKDDRRDIAVDVPIVEESGNSAQRIVKVRLTRKGCQPVVPFTLVRWKNGWLVKNIDLPSAGNPARSCGPEGTGAGANPGT